MDTRIVGYTMQAVAAAGVLCEWAPRHKKVPGTA